MMEGWCQPRGVLSDLQLAVRLLGEGSMRKDPSAIPVCAALVSETFAWVLKCCSAPLLRKIAGCIIVKHAFES